MYNDLPMIAIVGPTASGKTTLAATLAHRVGGEVVSADSRQVYRGMTIGTGKDLDDYVVNGQIVPYHLIDICQPGEKYNVFRYQADFQKVYSDLRKRQKPIVLCGGSGLYVEAVLRGYALSPVPQNKELREALAGKTLGELTTILGELKQQTGSAMHNTTDVDTAQRAIRAIEIETWNAAHPTENRAMPAPPAVVVGVQVDREERRRRITERLHARLEEGMIDEVKGLLSQGLTPEDLMYYGLEYRFVTEYIMGKTSRQEMEKLLEIAIHQFAKRQMTWFRGMERRGTDIHWISSHRPLEQRIDYCVKLAKHFVSER